MNAPMLPNSAQLSTTPTPIDAAETPCVFTAPAARVAVTRRNMLRYFAFGTAGLAAGAAGAAIAPMASAAAASTTGTGWGIVNKPANASPTTPQFPVMPPPTTVPPV